MRLVSNLPDLRVAQESDIAALVALEGGSFSTDRLDARAFRRFIRGHSAAITVAMTDSGTLAGYSLVLFRSNASVGRLYSIAVSDVFRGRGLGVRLLDAAESEVQRRGCRALRLEVRPDNAAAISLYEKRGYRLIGRYDGFYEDGTDALRFEKSFDRASRV